MKSNYLINDNIAVFTLDPKDKQFENMGLEILKISKKDFFYHAIFDLTLFDIISSEDIIFIEKLVHILKLHHIDVIVCNFNVYSASIIFHFIDDISFKTELNVQKAIDVIKNNKKK